MRILAIDTASDTACVGLVEDGIVRAEELVRVSAQHGETLLPRIAHVLEVAGVARSAIDLIAVGLGPGSFTGVRIGLASAKGLALGLGRPIVGVRSSGALASAIAGGLRIVAIDAKKSEIFASLWSHDGALACMLEDVHGAPATMAARIRELVGDHDAMVVGTGVAAYPAFVDALGPRVAIAEPGFDVVRAAALATLARSAFDQRGPDDLARLEPVYVRAADALLPGARLP